MFSSLFPLWITHPIPSLIVWVLACVSDPSVYIVKLFVCWICCAIVTSLFIVVWLPINLDEMSCEISVMWFIVIVGGVGMCSGFCMEVIKLFVMLFGDILALGRRSVI